MVDFLKTIKDKKEKEEFYIWLNEDDESDIIDDMVKILDIDTKIIASIK